MTTHTVYGQAYEVITWEMFGKLCFDLSEKILKTNEKFDRIVALAKGALPVVRPLADYLSIQEVSSIQIEFYTGIGTTAKTPVITQSLPVRIKGEKVLILDDIVDTGETLLLAKEYLGHHGAVDIKTASLINKPWTKINPDFFVQTSEAWVIFPWEVRETIKILVKMWKAKGEKPEEMKKSLAKLGYSAAEIALFL